MKAKKKTATARKFPAIAGTKPAAPPAPDSFMARVDAAGRERIAMLDRLSDRIGQTGRTFGTKRTRTHDEPEPHTFLCLTCGATHETDSGFCIEGRPDSIAIPIETLRSLELAAMDADQPRDKVAAYLISIGLYVLGRGGHRERCDLIDLWDAIEKRQKELERFAADPRDLAREERARHAAAATARPCTAR
jgi:hypothetical protein